MQHLASPTRSMLTGPLRALLVLLVGLALLAGTTGAAHAATTGPTWHYVQAAGAPGDPAAAQAALAQISKVGVVDRTLATNGGNAWLVRMQAAREAELVASPAIACVTSNRFERAPYWTMSSQFTTTGDNKSTFNVARTMGADAYWNATPAAFRGQNVDVALIDTGVAPGALRNSGAIIDGLDISFDSQDPNQRFLDGFGHGTHMAGIINGVAPNARIYNVKVGDSTGQVDVTQMIAAIDWVREHKNAPDGRGGQLNLRVLNISYGLVSANAWTSDELSKTVDAAWDDGIVVVVAAGNGGKADSKWDPGLATPAYNKNILAVGAYDSGFDRDPLQTHDDNYSAFSSGSSSSNKRTPDVVAPGRSIAAPRVPGSFADSEIEAGMCDGTGVYPLTADGQLVRGSGTSQAAAAASGAVALMLSKNPEFVPDDVKSLLQLRAGKVAGGSKLLTGEGRIDLAAVYNAKLIKKTAQKNERVKGGGPLSNTRRGQVIVDQAAYDTAYAAELARLAAQLAPVDPLTIPAFVTNIETFALTQSALDGEVDIFGKPFFAESGRSHAWYLDNYRDKKGNLTGITTWSADGQTYNGSLWNPNANQPVLAGVQWTVGPDGDQWANDVFVRVSWKDGGWVRGSWKDGNWVRGAWKDSQFVRGAWKDGDWVRGAWKDGSWVRGAWKDGNWVRGAWKEGNWVDNQWN